jgi:proline iminopeptidase
LNRGWLYRRRANIGPKEANRRRKGGIVKTSSRNRPLILLPGGPGLGNYLGPLAELVASDARTILPDPPAVGGSQVGPEAIVAMISELEGLRAEMSLRKWIVGGHSFGADLALAYALEHPDRVAGVLSISGTGVQDDRQWHAAYEAGRAAGRDPDHLDGIAFDADAHRTGLAAWRAYIKQPDLLRRIARLPVPFQAVYGSEDVRPNWPNEQLAGLVPDGRMTVIEGAGHWPWLTHPRETVAITRGFLERVLGS